MVERRWVDNVHYYDYILTTIEYDPIDAFTIARAEIHTPDRRHRIALTVVVTDQALRADRISVADAIRRGRMVLEELIQEHRALADQLTTNASRVYDLSGPRLRQSSPSGGDFAGCRCRVCASRFTGPRIST